MFCPACGEQIDDHAVTCGFCGTAVADGDGALRASLPENDAETARQNAADGVSSGVKVLCFFLPVVGLILYLKKRKTAPDKAKVLFRFMVCGFAAWAVGILSDFFSPEGGFLYAIRPSPFL